MNLPNIRCIEAAQALAKHDVMIPGNAASLLNNVDIELRLALLESAIAAIREEDCLIRQTTVVVCPDHSMRYELFVDQSASRCACVNFAIADTLTERFENAHPEAITFACRPFTSYIPAGLSFELER
ncbi:hypothetical protein [Caballeronia sp. LZ034LL]|uniref:hypothetical protein n=1 Tax=Caballeronia sp. LZ034LL TaxID=3038567 RepID=UPI00285FBC0B|nr:hypothetical protein [Caballeronia sp. LZ034LL]MDR5835222.1 hypothetical protein [Caballeronia sp. LZ034LL]